MQFLAKTFPFQLNQGSCCECVKPRDRLFIEFQRKFEHLCPDLLVLFAPGDDVILRTETYQIYIKRIQVCKMREFRLSLNFPEKHDKG